MMNKYAGWNGSCEDWLHGDEDLTEETELTEEGESDA